MKYFWIFLLALFLLILSANNLSAQHDTLHLYQAYTSFSNSEKAEWTAFENNWNYIEYTELKQKHKIKKLNCKNCESFYADIFLDINNEGELTSIEFKKGKICGLPISNDLFIKEFEDSLRAQRFKHLKNKRFIARFGNVLKC